MQLRPFYSSSRVPRRDKTQLSTTFTTQHPGQTPPLPGVSSVILLPRKSLRRGRGARARVHLGPDPGLALETAWPWERHGCEKRLELRGSCWPLAGSPWVMRTLGVFVHARQSGSPLSNALSRESLLLRFIRPPQLANTLSRIFFYLS